MRLETRQRFIRKVIELAEAPVQLGKGENHLFELIGRIIDSCCEIAEEFKMVLRIASRILDMIGMAISPVLEAAFDEMEYRFARRAVIEAARSHAGGSVLDQAAAHQLGQIEPERRA